MGQDCNQQKLGTTLTATITPSGTGFCANETAISGVGAAINGAGTTLYATRRHHRPQPVLMGVATQAYPESALEVRLSRMPLDLDTGASHHTQNHPIETLQLSRPPCPMRVDLTKTGRRQGTADGLPLCARSVATNVVLGRWIAVRCG